LRKGILLALAFIACQVHAGPEPVINFTIQHYPVTGASTGEISKSVFQNTPVQMSNGRFGAVTHNKFTTSYSTIATEQGGCEVKNARVQLDSTIVLPQLAETGQSAAVLKEWERYIGALRAHEQMHANNGRYTAETVASRLYDFKSGLSCVQMRAKLDQAVDLLIQNMGNWDTQLDAQTEHGKTQGAFLRPDFR
jgi:predicted secreted Zn-dependent protease